jgi:two-component system nitrogen regulation sensor histidine kinase GlnL
MTTKSSHPSRPQAMKSRAKSTLNLDAFHLLATLLLMVDESGVVLFANAAAQEVLGLPRRSIQGQRMENLFLEREKIKLALESASQEHAAVLRFDANLKKSASDSMPVHVVASPSEVLGQVIFELLPLEQQARKEREDRILDQAQANKELIRNLAHEIKNPLGGIRGAAQLLQMEIASKDLVEFTQVIIREADRLQTLVDRLLAPHRRPHVVSDVNIHEIFERVRSLILAEFPRGLKVQRDYDTSLPNFRGDLEQIIQAILNIAHNAAQALTERIEQGDAVIILKSRVARQVSFSNQRHRLALELHVIDNGPGVPASIKDRLFSPLVSGRDGGSGLGLNLAQSFIQQHHGLIECESLKGKTDFKILIPLQ